MKYLLLIALLVAVILSAGCVTEKNVAVVSTTSTPKPSTITLTTSPTVTSTQIKITAPPRYAVGDILQKDDEKYKEYYKLILDNDRESQVYTYITINKETGQNYYRYMSNDFDRPGHINQTELEKDNPSIVDHLIKDKIPKAPPPTPIIYKAQTGKNKYGAWDWVIDSKTPNEGYIVYSYLPSSDEYEARKVYKLKDGEWAVPSLGVGDCVDWFDKSQFEQDFPVLLKNERISNYWYHCWEWIPIK